MDETTHFFPRFQYYFVLGFMFNFWEKKAETTINVLGDHKSDHTGNKLRQLNCCRGVYSLQSVFLDALVCELFSYFTLDQYSQNHLL